jgi:RNA polymerase sigma-70 factor (ECF subfamily)
MLGNRQEAEDAVQDIFFKAYRLLGSYREQRTFSAWLYKIAANHCNTLLSKRARARLFSFLHPNETHAASAEQDYLDSEGTRWDWLREIPAQDRTLLVLRVIDGHSFEEIGRMLGTKPATLRKRFERLKAKLNGKPEMREALLHERRIELQ